MKILKFKLLIAFAGLLLLSQSVSAQTLTEGTFKIGKTLGLIDQWYVDTTNQEKLVEDAIVTILKDLDPHSTYVSAKDVREMNEPLQGNFDGIGIHFNLLNDTIIVIEPISGGPSEKAGLKAGDRIITINNEKVAGIKISTKGVQTRLMGPKGTIVSIIITRRGEKAPLDFTLVRDKIPIVSLDAAYMLDKETGYVRLNKFAATTEKEFEEALLKLRKSNMKHMIIDLRNNGGGYMLAATEMANHFFSDQKLLVYLIGRKTPRQNYRSTGNGDLSSSRVVVLTDEGSASASEIFAGALQDWDRGVIMGRRTFGKGLVQNGFYLTDGSMIRLTIARYYTPSGRSIQSSYKDGYEKYVASFNRRFSDGELLSADSIHFPDSLKFRTLINQRLVYGGGGIMPDVFVAADTSDYTVYLGSLSRKNVFNSFVLGYADKNRERILSEYKTFDNFNAEFRFTDQVIKDFQQKGTEAGVKFDEEQYKKSEAEIRMILKALVANNFWQTNEYFRIVNDRDILVQRALKLISDEAAYNKVIGKH
jgi:carboxyl-terminal processing protease